MTLRITKPAREELVEAAEYYETQQAGLADAFTLDFKQTVRRILDFPNAWPQYTTNARRRRMDRFPYGIAYRVRGGEVRILAVMNLHRDPKHWRDRLGDPL
jgi:plasmid stabilization system protein ParE